MFSQTWLTTCIDEAVGPTLRDAVSTSCLKASIDISSPLISAMDDPTLSPPKLLLVKTPEITNAKSAKPIIKINTVVRFLIFSNTAILINV